MLSWWPPGRCWWSFGGLLLVFWWSLSGPGGRCRPGPRLGRSSPVVFCCSARREWSSDDLVVFPVGGLWWSRGGVLEVSWWWSLGGPLVMSWCSVEGARRG